MARSTGEIVAKDSILIGESADVTAQIMATSIIVAGNVKGDIIGTQRIELRPSAKVLGKLTEPNLVACNS
jgi:cytoskeletal protein CcmA (bactofilin family)